MKAFLLFLLIPLTVYAQYTEDSFSTAQKHKRYQALVSELRCLVCQNQTIASSNSSLATDLRNIVFEKIEAGESDDAIRQFMVTRYGNFVLYDPPLNARTTILWFAPLLLVLTSLCLLIAYILRQAKRTRRSA